MAPEVFPFRERLNRVMAAGLHSRHVSEHEERPPDKRLLAIVGRWQTSGYVIGEPDLPVVGVDNYEALPGGYFVVHYVDVIVGDRHVQAIEIIGELDTSSGGYLARSFDSDGNTELMLLTIDDNGVFHFTGGPDIAPAAQPTDAPIDRVRSTLTIAQDGQSMAALWERSDDGASWQTWMDISFTRAT
jgi:hypothetical protein